MGLGVKGLLIRKLSSDTLRGGCQNYGPFLGALNNRCRTILGIQKGTIILTTTLRCLGFRVYALESWVWASQGAKTQRVQSTYMVECRVSILGITIMIWGGIPHNST